MTLLKRLFLILVNQDKRSLNSNDAYSQLTDEELVQKVVANNNTLFLGYYMTVTLKWFITNAMVLQGLRTKLKT